MSTTTVLEQNTTNTIATSTIKTVSSNIKSHTSKVLTSYPYSTYYMGYERPIPVPAPTQPPSRSGQDFGTSSLSFNYAFWMAVCALFIITVILRRRALSNAAQTRRRGNAVIILSTYPGNYTAPPPATPNYHPSEVMGHDVRGNVVFEPPPPAFEEAAPPPTNPYMTQNSRT